MSGCTIIIEEHEDDDTPVTGCGCEHETQLTFGECVPVTDAVLTPGDPSPCARCPDCDGLIYLDRPIDRLTDAARHLCWVAENAPVPRIDVPAAISDLEQRLRDVLPGHDITITISKKGA